MGNAFVYGAEGGVKLPALSNPASASDILSGKQAIGANGQIITGNIPTKSAQTYTPGTTSQTISAGRYLSGAQTIQGDTDLVPGNIRDGVNIFGVTGTYEGQSGVTIGWSTISTETCNVSLMSNSNQMEIALGRTVNMANVVAISGYMGNQNGMAHFTFLNPVGGTITYEDSSGDSSSNCSPIRTGGFTGPLWMLTTSGNVSSIAVEWGLATRYLPAGTYPLYECYLYTVL